MKRRWIVLLVTTSLLVLGSSFALGADRSELPQEMQTVSQVAAACDAMHRSAAMQEMLQQMPAELRARCDATHRKLTQMMGPMDGAGMMGQMDGSGMMGSA